MCVLLLYVLLFVCVLLFQGAEITTCWQVEGHDPARGTHRWYMKENRKLLEWILEVEREIDLDTKWRGYLSGSFIVTFRNEEETVLKLVGS